MILHRPHQYNIGLIMILYFFPYFYYYLSSFSVENFILFFYQLINETTGDCLTSDQLIMAGNCTCRSTFTTRAGYMD